MAESEQTIRRYLLGLMSEAEQSALEEKYFTDPPAFNQVLKVESELVDSYVRGQLPGDERERFERSYMAHPARKGRVEFAAALASRLDQIHHTATVNEQTASRWQRFVATIRGQNQTLKLATGVALLLVILSGGWLLVDNWRRQSKSEQIRAAQEAERQRHEREQATKNASENSATVERGPEHATQPMPSPSEDSGSRVVSLALVAGGVRGSDSNKVPTLVISSTTTQAQLKLNLPENNYPTYQASLKTITGAEIFSQQEIKPGRGKSSGSFVFTLPASKFSNGDYVLTLQGVNPSGEVDDLSKSLFRVVKK